MSPREADPQGRDQLLPSCRAINWIIFSLAAPQSQAENPSGSSRRCWVESLAAWFFPCMVFLSWHVSLGFAGTSPPPHHGLHNDDSLEEHVINALLLPFPPPGLFSLTEKAKNLNNSQNCGMVWVERTLNLITASTVPSNLDQNTFYLFFFSVFLSYFFFIQKNPTSRFQEQRRNAIHSILQLNTEWWCRSRFPHRAWKSH